MKVNQLRYFIEVAQARSFSKAAANLFISQPSISHAIMKLEEEFEIRLFERYGSTKLTKEGEIFLQYAKGLVEKIQRLESYYIQEEVEEKIDLKIGMDQMLFLDQLLITFYKQNKALPMSLTVYEEHREKVIIAVQRGQAQCGFIVYPMEELQEAQEELQRQGIVWKHLVEGTYEEITRQHTFQYKTLHSKFRVFTDKHTIYQYVEEMGVIEQEPDLSIYTILIIQMQDTQVDEIVTQFLQEAQAYFHKE